MLTGTELSKVAECVNLIAAIAPYGAPAPATTPPQSAATVPTTAGQPPAATRRTGDGRKAMTMSPDTSDIDVGRPPVVVDLPTAARLLGIAAPRRTSWCGPASGRHR